MEFFVPEDVINFIPFYSTNGILYSRNCRGYNGVETILTCEINCRQFRIRFSSHALRCASAISRARHYRFKKKNVRCIKNGVRTFLYKGILRAQHVINVTAEYHFNISLVMSLVAVVITWFLIRFFIEISGQFLPSNWY